ncbi:IPT/TIG domain-containing protein [Shewanella sp. C32]|uniref:IPT/TIG domain-containing protein n=1 Tax=Shewanella electrica TaxID=515560 RepID=A0ABT2FQJ0_9GAMM|nr:IPT/TIG domain-containing protein [Shewanella electrica]MCH1926993.1 IPT/TIG domain-containing protein [Shewanella electrica]MCS4558614.1 IPT/TIG domain-containing protein [Shewanella electrica]
MKHKQYLVLLLAAVVVSASSNSALARTDTNKNSQNNTQVGTWENPDEDGDGIPDELDDFPFDPNRGRLPTIEEEEFNNNVGQANIVDSIPARISGVIDKEVDIDDFKFSISRAQVEAQKYISVVLYKDDPKFTPILTILDDNGSVVQSSQLAIDNTGRIGATIFFIPKNVGNYNVSVSDKYANGADSFTYTIDVFLDQDRDGVADEQELALGMDPELQDTDGDGILDGNEYHVFINQTERLLDADNDGIPNWLDDDSDGDGIPDRAEGTGNQDADLLPNFVDTDSDNDGINDSIDQLGVDTDSDHIANYADVDDDGDLLIDSNDPDPLTPLMLNSNVTLSATSFTTNNGDDLVNQAMAYLPLTISGKNLPKTEVFVVLNKRGNNGQLVNIKATPTDSNNLEIVIPDFANIALGGEEFDLFVVADGKRTNELRVKLLDNNTPMLYKLSPTNATPGDTITVTGEHFVSGTKINWGIKNIKLNVTSKYSANFAVPDDAVSGYAYLSNQYGESRYLNLWVGRPVALNITVPNEYLNLTGPFHVSFIEETYTNLTDIDGTDYRFEASSPDTVLVSNSDNVILLRAIIMPSDTSVALTLDSTIEAMALTGYLYNKTEQQIREARVKLPTIDAYQQLASYVRSGINDPEKTFAINNLDVAGLIYTIQKKLKSN